ncbi:hypothetical protein DL96DRAFT_1608262 [Flagelloscypha sp. PMI_526]|nr:hypothetical protein DL96DRAFT_1608262 [Flagelloscypha sp. PMI_526]
MMILSDSTGDSSPLPATSFQDLSAVLSLLAADTVEKKLSTESSYDWERMSSVWSTFGLVGAVRFNLKVCAGIASSERAGVNLAGAGGYTSFQTADALSYWKLGDPNPAPVSGWRDVRNQILARLTSSSPAWVRIRPFYIVFGYSQCPFSLSHFRCILELLVPMAWSLLTAALTTLPSVLLIGKVSEGIQIATLALQVGTGLSAGVLGPLLLHRHNSQGVAHLRDLPQSRANRGVVVQEGDHIMTSVSRMETQIVWQTPETTKGLRSGDFWWMRLLCGFNTLVILGAYICSYVCLSTAPVTYQYAWLAVQAAILLGRYVLWARRPLLFPHRPHCLLYAVSSSIAEPLPVDIPKESLDRDAFPTLSREVIDFAVASAGSKVLNKRIEGNWRVQRPSLLDLANAAPSDLVDTRHLTTLKDHFPPTKDSTLFVHRLPWSFVEEVYAAQGLILGLNPWALGGLYLGAVLAKPKIPSSKSAKIATRPARFLGLTAVHPFREHVSRCSNRSCACTHDRFTKAGITREGYLISNLVDGSVESYFAPVEPDLAPLHDQFLTNIDRCRSTSRSNGPGYVEIHAATRGKDISRMEQQSDAWVHGEGGRMNLSFVEKAIAHAKTKRHFEDDCFLDACGVPMFPATELTMKAK